MSAHDSRVAIIPARGGSQRIPRKNIVDFCGKPLIAWTIEAALETELFDNVIVSTDDEEIADISTTYGASVPVMRTSAADNYTPVSQATIATLEDLAHRSKTFDVVVQLFAVCPLRTSRDICNAYDFFRGSRTDFVLSCYAFHWMNPWWAFTKDQRGISEPLFPGPVKRSQDLPPVFGPTGAIWIARTESLLSAGTFYGPEHRFFEIDWKHAIDIDDQDDLDFASALLSAQERG